MHVAVLMGGWSSERDVSLVSGEGVAKACEAAGVTMYFTGTRHFAH